MNWSLGFGLERIGLLALRFPRAATLFLVVSIVISAFGLLRLEFDGNIVSVLDKNSAAYADFAQQADTFHDYSGDVSIILRSNQLMTAKTLEELRNLHLDLSLEDGVDSIFSIFSLGDIAAESDATENLLPVEFVDDQQARDTIARLIKSEPATRSIIAPKEGAMMMLVRLQADAQLSDVVLNEQLGMLEKSLQSLMPPGVTFWMSGIPQVRATIVDAIIQDQTLLTALGIILGCVVSWFIFGTVRAALICTVPAFVAVLWTLAAFSFSNTPLNLFSTSLPSLALIITFADTIVLYFRWQSLNRSQAKDPLNNLRQSIRLVGSASSLTSITTALAFASLSWASAESMDQFAIFGVAAVVSAFLAMIVGLPVAGYWFTRLPAKGERLGNPRFSRLGEIIATFTTAVPRLTLLIALAFLAVFVWVHNQLRPSYALEDYLPHGSQVRTAEDFAARVFGGTSQYYVLVPTAAGKTYFDRESRERLIAVHTGVVEEFGAERTQSLAPAWKRLTDSQIGELVTAIDEAPSALRGRFVSRDRDMVQVSAATNAGQNTLLVEKQIADLRTRLANLSFADEIKVTGFAVLLAEEFPKLISELRTGLLVSIFLAMIVIAFATRSPALAAASLIPNLIPILFTQAIIWFSGANLSVSNVIALTIAFGIAIDNAVHVINAYEKTRGRHKTVVGDVQSAVCEISPALIASTCIICVAAIITQFSSMPSVAELGLLLIATLVVALISNLIILPSALIIAIGFGNAIKTKRIERKN